MTDVPVGAWTVTLLLYLSALFFGVTGIGIAIGLAMGLGILAALAAIATGFMDWMDVDPTELAVGLIHATVNIIGTLLFILSWIMLSTSQWAVSIANFIPALVGYLLMAVGAYLGGALVFRLGTMINRNAYRSGPKDFTPVIGFEELAEFRNAFEDVEKSFQWLKDNGYIHLAALTDALGGKDSAKGWLIKNKFVSLGIMVDAAAGNKSAVDWLIKAGEPGWVLVAKAIFDYEKKKEKKGFWNFFSFGNPYG